MYLKNNPFHILVVTPESGRREIISNSEDRSFELGEDKCSDAQNMLLNLSKRLLCELQWFIDMPHDQTERDIKPLIEANKEIDVSQLSGISKLNAFLHNLECSDTSDIYEIAYMILSMDDIYEHLSVADVVKSINASRCIAGFPLVSDFDVEEALLNFRNIIIKNITLRIERLSKISYRNLATLIAETYMACDNYDGIIISDLISQYELKFIDDITQEQTKIEADIDKIIKRPGEYIIKDQIDSLLYELSNWILIAKPIAVLRNKRGTNFEQSISLFNNLRNLSVVLNNEKDHTEFSLFICEAIKRCSDNFEIPFNIDEDIEVIKEILQEKKEEQALQKQAAERNRDDKEYLVTINTVSYTVPQYCTCCMKPTTYTEEVRGSIIENSKNIFDNRKTVHTTTCKFPICPECMAHRKDFEKKETVLCAAAIAIGIILMIVLSILYMDEELIFGYGFLGAILTIISFLIISCIVKTEELDKHHVARNESVSISRNDNVRSRNITIHFKNWRYANLFCKMNGKDPKEIKEQKCNNSAKRQSYIKAYRDVKELMLMLLGAYICAAAVTFIIMGLFGAYDSPEANSSKRSSITNNSNSVYHNSPIYNNSSDGGNLDMINSLKEELDLMKADIDYMEKELDDIYDDVDYYKSMYNITKSDEFINLYNSSIEHYNNVYDRYSNLIDDYNEKVNEYNLLIGAN